MDDHGTKWRRKIVENFNRLSRVHERYRQTTDGRAKAYSERELTSTFANKLVLATCVSDRPSNSTSPVITSTLVARRGFTDGGGTICFRLAARLLKDLTAERSMGQNFSAAVKYRARQ